MRQSKRSAKTKNQGKTNNVLLFTWASIGLLFCIVFIGIILFLKSYHSAKRTIIIKTNPTATPTSIPTPTIDFSQQNIMKTYTSNLYGFSVIYPSLGEDTKGNIISCGDDIEELVTINKDLKSNAISLPTIHIDSFYEITLHPWGSQLEDYLIQQNIILQNGFSLEWIHAANVDEAVIIHTTGNSLNNTPAILALYKKGNLIYQLEKTHGYNSGCQMLFDPRNYNETSIAPNQSELFKSLLFDQYKNWNEATSIQFSK